MRKKERNKMRTNPWANKGSRTSPTAGKYKLVQPREQVQKGGMGPVVVPKKENRQEEAIVLTAFQQGKSNSSSKKGTGSTGTHSNRSRFKWFIKKRQQEDENAKLLQQISNDKDPRQKLQQSSSRDSVWTNVTKDSVKSSLSKGSTSIWTYRSRDALNMSVVRSSHSKDAIMKSRSKDSSIASKPNRDRLTKNASEESLEQWKNSIWINQSKDALNMSVVRLHRSSRGKDPLKSSLTKESAVASNPNRDKLTRNASEEDERKNDDLTHNDLLILQKRKSAWLRNMKYFQAQEASKLDEDKCDHAECRRDQDHEERDLEEQQPSADELGIFALKKNIQSPSPSSPTYIKPDQGDTKNNQFSTFTKVEGNTTDDNNLGGVPGSMAVAMAAAMDGIQRSNCLDYVANSHAVDVANEQMAGLYYKVATVSRVDNEAQDIAGDHCFTIPLLADIKEHVGNFQWTDCVSSSQGDEAAKSCNDHSTTCTSAIMATDTTACPRSPKSACTTSPVVVDIIHKAMLCQNDHYNVEASRTAEECNNSGGESPGMTTMIGADGSLYQVQVLRRLPTQEAKKIRAMPTPPRQAAPLSAALSVVQSSPGAPCSNMQEQPDNEEKATNNKHDDDDNNNNNNNDIGSIVVEQDVSVQDQGKQQEQVEKHAPSSTKEQRDEPPSHHVTQQDNGNIVA